MDQLQDRQDAQIWNAIEAKNLKQALKLIDKRLAKKHTDYHEALKIYIRSLSPQVTEKSAVLQHLLELAEKKPALSQLVVIELYDDALGEVVPDSQEYWARIIGELRWQYVKSSPKDEESSSKCFQACLANDDLDHARQISNTLEKSFPQNHAYIFWNISTMFLYSTSKKCPDMQKKIWGGLALGQMGKLAIATKQAADQKVPLTRSIQTPQELLLLHRVTQAFGKSEQRLEYLRDPLLGPESAVAKGEWELWRMKLALLEESKEWNELFETTGSLLKRARTTGQASQYAEARLSDWIVWDAYIRSATHLGAYEFSGRVRTEVEAHLDPACAIDKSWKRNASLALVKLAFENSVHFAQGQPKSQDPGDPSYQVTTVINYLQRYGNASTAYNDLRPYVSQLTQSNQEQLLKVLVEGNVFTALDPDSSSTGQNLSTARQITEAINASKLKYLLSCSIPEDERRHSSHPSIPQSRLTCRSCSQSCKITCSHCLSTVAGESIESYRASIEDDSQITKDLLATDRHPADDFSVLAAICLIKKALADSDSTSEILSTKRTTHLLQAVALLEYAWTRSKSNFQLSILLVRLYSYLGCGSLAMRAFQRLALKQVQLDTLSYILFDRMSTLHPRAFTHSPEGSDRSRSPIEHLQKHQKLYTRATDHITKNVWMSFKHSNYNSIFEMKEVEESLSCSLARVMSVVESKKILRMTEPAKSLTEISQACDILPNNADDVGTEFNDTNDYDTFPDFESAQGSRFEKLSKFTPGPSAYRYRLNLVTEKLFQLIDLSPSAVGEDALLQQWLKQHVTSQAQSATESDMAALTLPESLAHSAYKLMLNIIHDACNKERWAEPDIRDKIDGYNSELMESLQTHLASIDKMSHLVPAFASTLHALYIAHEVGITVLNFCSYISKGGKDVYEKQTEANKQVRDVAQRLLQAVTAKCTVIKQGHDESGWIDRVLGSVLPEDDVDGDSLSVEKVLKELVDDNFMEAWAGEVVESWKDSIVGLSLLKEPSKG